MPTARQKIEQIAAIYETRKRNDDGTYTSNHMRFNLEGALYDLERAEADPVCLRTIRRIVEQLASIETVLGASIDD